MAKAKPIFKAPKLKPFKIKWLSIKVPKAKITYKKIK